MTRRTLAAALSFLLAAMPADACRAQQAPAAENANDHVADFGEYGSAASAILDEIGQPGEKAALPDANAPSFRRFVAAAQAISPALGRPGMALGPDTLDPICGPAIKVLVAYQLAGLSQSGEGAKGQAGAERTEEIIRGNLAKYLDQLLPILIFSGHCQAVHLDAVRSFANALPQEKWTPARVAGARQIRDGIFQTIFGMIVMAADPSMPAPARSSILASLAADATSFAPALSLDLRGKLADALRALPHDLTSRDRHSVETIARSLNARTCDKLCSI